MRRLPARFWFIALTVIIVAVVIFLIFYVKNMREDRFASEDRFANIMKQKSGTDNKKSVKKKIYGHEQPRSLSDFRDRLDTLTEEIRGLEERMGALEIGYYQYMGKALSEGQIRNLLEKIKEGKCDVKELGKSLQRLEPEKSYNLFKEIWPQLENVQDKKDLFRSFINFGERSFAESPHPRTLDIMDMIINDPEYEMQIYGLGRLKAKAFVDFTADIEGYRKWQEQIKDMTFNEYHKELVQSKIASAQQDDEELFKFLKNLFGWAHSGGGCGIPEGFIELYEYSIKKGTPRVASKAVELLEFYGNYYEVGEETVREVVHLVLNNPFDTRFDMSARSEAFRLLRRYKFEWSKEYLREVLKKNYQDPKMNKLYHIEAARALGRLHDYSAIPHLIDALDEEHIEEDIDDILESFAGMFSNNEVTYGKEWWKAWWEKNKDFYLIEQ